MNLRRRMTLMRDTPPRGLRALDRRPEAPDQNRLSDLQVSRRVEPLLPLIAAGAVPVDGHEAAVGRAIERVWNRETEHGMGAAWQPKTS